MVTKSQQLPGTTLPAPLSSPTTATGCAKPQVFLGSSDSFTDAELVSDLPLTLQFPAPIVQRLLPQVLLQALDPAKI